MGGKFHHCTNWNHTDEIKDFFKVTFIFPFVDCLLLQEDNSTLGAGVEASHAAVVNDGEPPGKREAEGNAAEGANKFYCYLCTITCHSQEVGHTSANKYSLTF